jgi:glycosyltransferase involved in cell wall biosynthesis
VPATAYDIIAGILVGWLIVRRHRVRIVHARSYVAGCVALALKRLLGVRFLFDMRGFWVDERIDGKIWRPSEWLYRWAKAYEAMCLKAADAIVSLTEAAKTEIEAFDYLADRCPPIAVIPTCVDLDRFRPREPFLGAGPDKPWRLVYSGALGTWYLLDEMVAFFCALKKRIPRARFLILTQTPEAVTVPAGFADEDIDVHAVPFGEVPAWIARGNVGVIFSSATWSNKARCPTKLGEFLACGLPVVISRGIGDTETIVREERVGVVVDKLAGPAYEKAVEELLVLLSEGDLGERCRRAAARHLSLQDGVLRYLQIYERLIRL